MERLAWSGNLTAAKSGDSGLLEMLHEAYDLYQVEVVNQGKLYQRYADDFVYGHEFHDAIDAWSKNEHQKNYRIVDSLLSNRRDLIETYFNKDTVNDADLMEMIHLFNTTLPSSNSFVPRTKIRETSDFNLCSCLDNDDLIILARCCNDAQIFNEVINASDLLSLLDGEMTMPLHSRNNRLVAFFFDQLSLYNLIIRNWQNVLAHQRCIVSSTGKNTLTQKSLSSALYSIVDLEMSAQEKIIDDAVRPIGQKYQRKRKTDK